MVAAQFAGALVLLQESNRRFGRRLTVKMIMDRPCEMNNFKLAGNLKTKCCFYYFYFRKLTDEIKQAHHCLCRG
jgi:hypothetical protein